MYAIRSEILKATIKTLNSYKNKMACIDAVFEVKDHAEQIKHIEELIAFYSRLLQHEVQSGLEEKHYEQQG